MLLQKGSDHLQRTKMMSLQKKLLEKMAKRYYALWMDAQINLSMEVYVRGTELWSSDAAN
jgi:hypothetical protein